MLTKRVPSACPCLLCVPQAITIFSALGWAHTAHIGIFAALGRAEGDVGVQMQLQNDK